MEVEVIIPHWNRAGMLHDALESLQQQSRTAPVCVVDNASSDGSQQMVRSEFPEVRLLELDRNVGFGAALNRGVQTSSAELVVFLNNDAVADQRFIAEMAAAGAASGEQMIAGCLRMPDGRIDSIGIELDRSLGTYDLGRGEPYAPSALRGRSPLAPTGGAAGFGREAFLSVGGFDERLFAYLEDVDLGMRMRMAGFGCAAAFDAFAWHHHAGTLGSGTAAKNRMLGESRAYLIWKYGSNLSPAERWRGGFVDLLVAGGQALFDRNLGTMRGRAQAWLRLRRSGRPPADHRFRSVPRVPLSVGEALRRRRGRRGPSPAG